MIITRYLPRNSMGAKVVRSPRNAKGKPRNFYPVTFSPQLVFPASPVHGPFVSQYMESPKRSQISDVSASIYIYSMLPWQPFDFTYTYIYIYFE